MKNGTYILNVIHDTLTDCSTNTVFSVHSIVESELDLYIALDVLTCSDTCNIPVIINENVMWRADKKGDSFIINQNLDFYIKNAIDYFLGGSKKENPIEDYQKAIQCIRYVIDELNFLNEKKTLFDMFKKLSREEQIRVLNEFEKMFIKED